MIFEEKYRKLSQNESDCISSTMNKRPVEQKLKRPIFDDFWRNVSKLPKTGSDRISSTANGRPVRPKLEGRSFYDFWRKIPKFVPERKWLYLVNDEQ
jgi:hypothetical protein